MYAIAMSVAACIRAGTRVDVAWAVDGAPGAEVDAAEALAITPGGGRLGSLISGALDGQLIELAGIRADNGRLLRLDIGPGEAALSGIDPVSGVACMLVPGAELPAELWAHLVGREPVCLVSALDGGTVTGTSLYTAATIADSSAEAQQLFERGASATAVLDEFVITVLWPRPTIVLVGGGEIAEALERMAAVLGWQCVGSGQAAEATGLVAALSPLDGVVVLGHDLELAGETLLAALRSEVGYIGAVGPRHLQQAREDWLAYRGVSDPSRIHRPAGLDIGARNPREVALAIMAEVIATQTGSTG